MPAGAMERKPSCVVPESVSNEHVRSVCLGLPSDGGFRL
jgi:hypothetical protein